MVEKEKIIIEALAFLLTEINWLENLISDEYEEFKEDFDDGIKNCKYHLKKLEGI